MAPVLRQLAEQETVSSVVCNTGQHKEMLQPLLSLFNIQPDIDLEMMLPGQSLSDMTAVSSALLGRVMSSVKPHLVIVQGDTTTAMVAGMVAFYHRIPVAHVEAGLRTHRVYSPFPEETNRRVLGGLCSLCYAPTSLAATNLAKEGVPPVSIKVTGNTAIDNLLWTLKKTNANNNSAQGKQTILVTAHRRENWGQPMKNIAHSVRLVAEQRPDVNIVFPLHRNPLVRKLVRPELENMENVELIEPLDYEEFVRRMSEATIILTDSGGIQEEASGLAVPVLILRNDTERSEGVSAGVSKLVGTNPATVVEETLRLLDGSEAYKSMAQQAFPYGAGNAAEIIVNDIVEQSDSLKNFAKRSSDPNHFNLNEETLFHPERAISPQFSRSSKKGSIAVILTIYKRDHLKEQIAALKKQTHQPDIILVFQNENHINISGTLKKHPEIRHIHSTNHNFKFHGRFTLPLLLDTEYVAIFDDDILPGERWLEHAIDVSRRRNALVGANGRIIKATNVNSRRKWQYSVDAGKSVLHDDDKEVDFVGHCWVFKREWIHYFWKDPPVSWHSGEDIALAATFKIHGHIRSFVPRMPKHDKSLWGEIRQRVNYGGDKHASFKKTPNSIREQIAQYYINQGWQTLKRL